MPVMYVLKDAKVAEGGMLGSLRARTGWSAAGLLRGRPICLFCLRCLRFGGWEWFRLASGLGFREFRV